MTNQKWTNFNDAEDQMSYGLIPHKTIAKVQIKIKRGDYVTDQWVDGYATKSKFSNSVYLACEFVVISGEYEHRKIWSNIGLHSDNSDKYAEIGRSMIKAILNSANNLHPKDNSPQAQKMREIEDFGKLNDLQIIAEIIIDDKSQIPKNEIKTIITPDNLKYDEYMNTKKANVKNSYNTKTLNKGAKAQGSNDFFNDEMPF